jgi:hypothetical protein
VAAAWLAGAAGSLPLGDVIASDAVIDAAIGGHGLDIQLLAELRKRAPVRTAAAPGTCVAGWMHNVGVVTMVSPCLLMWPARSVSPDW